MNANPIEILLVEDNLGDIRLTTEAFKEGRLLNNISFRRSAGEGVGTGGVPPFRRIADS